jgi:uncharacterized protein (TIGR04222 family)
MLEQVLAHGGLWLLDPVIHLPGPEFLVLFGVLAVMGLIATRILVNRSTRSDLPRLKIPERLDPYAIAYLRGGDTEVIRTAMVELVEEGWIVQVSAPMGILKKVAGTTPKWKTDLQGKSIEEFSLLQQVLLKHFQVPHDGASVFNGSLRLSAREESKVYRKWVNDEELLNNRPFEPSVRLSIWSTFLAIVGLGLYKFLHALSEHRSNVAFLGFGLFILGFLFYLVTLRTRLSSRGNQFLKDIQTACVSVRSLRNTVPEPARSKYSTRSGVLALAGDASMPLLAMGVFGISSLQGSQLDRVFVSYRKSAANVSGCSSGGCGGSSGDGSSYGDGSSCGGGSSCGSGLSCGGGSSCGGGGCGGGGCGGCGS